MLTGSCDNVEEQGVFQMHQFSLENKYRPKKLTCPRIWTLNLINPIEQIWLSQWKIFEMNSARLTITYANLLF